MEKISLDILDYESLQDRAMGCIDRVLTLEEIETVAEAFELDHGASMHLELAMQCAFDYALKAESPYSTNL